MVQSQQGILSEREMREREREYIRWLVKGLDRNKDNRGEVNREVDEQIGSKVEWLYYMSQL